MSQQACGETEAQRLAHNQRDRHGPPASLSSLSVRGKCLHLEPSRSATSRQQDCNTLSLSGPYWGCSPGADSRLTPTAQLPAHGQARSGKRRGEPGAAPLQAHGQLLSPQTGAPLSLVTFNWPKGLAGSIPLALGNGSEGRGGRTWGQEDGPGLPAPAPPLVSWPRPAPSCPQPHPPPPLLLPALRLSAFYLPGAFWFTKRFYIYQHAESAPGRAGKTLGIPPSCQVLLVKVHTSPERGGARSERAGSHHASQLIHHCIVPILLRHGAG